MNFQGPLEAIAPSRAERTAGESVALDAPKAADPMRSDERHSGAEAAESASSVAVKKAQTMAVSASKKRDALALMQAWTMGYRSTGPCHDAEEIAVLPSGEWASLGLSGIRLIDANKTAARLSEAR
jgi:hypothetical protein